MNVYRVCPNCDNTGNKKFAINLEAERRMFPFNYTKNLLNGKTVSAESQVQVDQLVLTCNQCKHEWEDEASEELLKLAISNAKTKAEKVILDCPCCGKEQSTEEWVIIDALYPDGSYYVIDPDVGIHFVSRAIQREKYPDALQMWQYHCNVSAGGCGLQVSSFSAQETIDTWNKRA